MLVKQNSIFCAIYILLVHCANWLVKLTPVACIKKALQM